MEIASKLILLPLLSGVLLYVATLVAERGHIPLSALIALTGALYIAYFYEFH
jgi:hypothetical protein